MSMKKHASWLMALALIVPLAACQAEPEEEVGEVEMEEPVGETVEREAAFEADDLDADLESVGDTEVSGDVDVSETDGMLQVDLSVDGLEGPGEYQAHIHSGTCEAGPGGVVAPLTAVQGTAEGEGESTTTIARTDLPMSGPLSVQVHGSTGSPILCGTVRDAEM